jgi:hypothetical protein
MTPYERSAWSLAPPEFVAVVARTIDSTSRVELRNSAICAVIERYCSNSEMTRTAAARKLAGDLRAGQHGTVAGDEMAAIFALNNRRTLGWRQIMNIVGPVSSVQDFDNLCTPGGRDTQQPCINDSSMKPAK